MLKLGNGWDLLLRTICVAGAYGPKLSIIKKLITNNSIYNQFCNQIMGFISAVYLIESYFMIIYHDCEFDDYNRDMDDKFALLYTHYLSDQYSKHLPSIINDIKIRLNKYLHLNHDIFSIDQTNEKEIIDIISNTISNITKFLDFITTQSSTDQPIIKLSRQYTF